MNESIASRLDRIEELLTQAVGMAVIGPRKMLTPSEFAYAVRKSRSAVTRYCQRGQVKAVRSTEHHGRAWRIPVEEVQRFRDEGPRPIPGATFSSTPSI